MLEQCFGVVLTQGSGCVPKILKIEGSCDGGKPPNFSWDFPGVFLKNPPEDPRNSHSLLEFSVLQIVPGAGGQAQAKIISEEILY